ncbi:gamma-glutamyl-gamma-aminobutyrate hydrolase family protein [Desulfococcaceae bacterium OttesenSCG-928-F15]|nr:gamma-glutamyl-gamma-aminobutyrate hydrolase family protein [Desulfococcaceae bacterium OttesenSCG-928-F15]
MTTLAITQRVDISHTGERRDALDQNWTWFASFLDADILPLPNLFPLRHKKIDLFSWMTRHQVTGVILSGGNTPVIGKNRGWKANDIAPERDRLESLLLEQLPSKGIPIVGVCRGLQMINLFYGGALEKVQHHVAVTHRLKTQPQASDEFYMQVNSFHQFGITIDGLASDLEALAFAEDGTVEALQHKFLPVYAVMWHPERENPFQDEDINCFKKWLLPRN